MDVASSIFAFDIKQLFEDGTEKCFEMNKAGTYPVNAKDHEATDVCYMFWLFGEDTFPEMQMAIRKAKQDCGYLWCWDCTEGSVAELIFHKLALQKVNQANGFLGVSQSGYCAASIGCIHLRQLQLDSAKSVDSASDGMTTSIPDVDMCTMCDESVSTYYNPVPGINTILSCAERKVPVDAGTSSALTANVREKMEEIRQMFYESDSTTQHQETLAAGMSTMGLMSTLNTCGPSARVSARKDAPSALPATHPRGLQVRNDGSPSLHLAQPQEPLGLQIFKDPEGLAACGAEPMRSRQPLRTVNHASAMRRPPPPSSDEENLGFVGVRRDAIAQIDSAGMTMSNFTLPLVFDPPCASTSVFTGSIVPSSIASAPLNPAAGIQSKQQRQQLEEENDEMVVEMGSLSPSPSRPDSPLADAFNLFVRSPDPSGRLRIDATKFMDAFLTKKVDKRKNSDSKRPPLF
ncbi:unnamed protein product [Hydatigera taeniaeformis]|uniref:Alpha/beta-hydrolase n=1 Tax=Hydatigena taeniaeformis TaxID=6205 RepID=A0A0R3WZQ5_HYDTA|nr:unnamed protein product [Hydatigera taeniaeformis]